MGPGIGLAVDLVFGLLDRATKVTALIQQSKTTGVDITAAQLDALVADDDVARAKLQSAIDKARKEGR